MAAFGRGEPPSIRDPFGSELTREVRPNSIIWRSRASGLIHRPRDLPAIEWRNGCKEWYRHGERHREDGPAVIMQDGTAEWWKDGKRHRDGGPAVYNGSGRAEWWQNGVQLDEKEIAALQLKMLRDSLPALRRPAPRKAMRYKL